MIISREHPESRDALIALVMSAAKDARSVTVQAGHFLLYYDVVEDQLLPCISSELTSPRHEILRKSVGAFPLLSWQLGLEILNALGADRKHIMVVVNDWQYLPRTVERRIFYDAFRRLPHGYSEALQLCKGTVNLLEPPSGSVTRPFYGEMNLRHQYRKTVEALIAKRLLPDQAVLEQGLDELVCSLPDAVGRRWEVYCSNKTGDCAAEIAQMLHLAELQTHCDCFINLYPAVCRDYVERGTELGHQLLGNRIKTVLNLGFQTSAIETIEDLCSTSDIACHHFSVNEPDPPTS
jgi:hypothetical protein